MDEVKSLWNQCHNLLTNPETRPESLSTQTRYIYTRFKPVRGLHGLTAGLYP